MSDPGQDIRSGKTSTVELARWAFWQMEMWGRINVRFGSKADISVVTFTAHGVIWAERSLGSKGGASPFSATFLLAVIEAF